MKFRTEIEIRPSKEPLQLTDKMVSLGSCFSQAIGSRLASGGVEIDVTPMGILFNPVSIAQTVKRALDNVFFTHDDLYRDENGTYHALAFESRRQGKDADVLLDELNRAFELFAEKLKKADVWLVTFGTAWCFRHLPTESIVGNCHKLPDKEFERVLCSQPTVNALWDNIMEKAPRVIFTVSPVRHLNNGLHGNTLSKSILHLAVNDLCTRYGNAEYFPAYEALNDDLRDYRFYADDLRHPSAMAEEYIFELFSTRYLDKEGRIKIEENRRKALFDLHRPIIK